MHLSHAVAMRTTVRVHGPKGSTLITRMQIGLSMDNEKNLSDYVSVKCMCLPMLDVKLLHIVFCTPSFFTVIHFLHNIFSSRHQKRLKFWDHVYWHGKCWIQDKTNSSLSTVDVDVWKVPHVNMRWVKEAGAVNGMLHMCGAPFDLRGNIQTPVGNPPS